MLSETSPLEDPALAQSCSIFSNQGFSLFLFIIDDDHIYSPSVTITIMDTRDTKVVFRDNFSTAVTRRVYLKGSVKATFANVIMTTISISRNVARLAGCW